jgi:LAS superfamily LD-carboxypeptidase LdcB
MNELELTGRARTHIVELDQPRCGLHYAAATSFLAMRDAAVQAGLDLVAASSFRDFDRQLHLWNAKWRGERPLLDAAGRPLDAAALEEDERIAAILRWSALPGGSRHHWGSDIDVIDSSGVPDGYRVQLVAEEYAPGGVFAQLTPWLDANMGRFGFYRPYASALGGAGVEAWHLSYWPVASEALETLTLPVLRHASPGDEG